MTELQAILNGLERSTKAALTLARELAASRQDPDEWTRLPTTKSRCPVSNFSRSKVVRLIEAGAIRDKHVGKSRFYSCGDMRRYLAES